MLLKVVILWIISIVTQHKKPLIKYKADEKALKYIRKWKEKNIIVFVAVVQQIQYTITASNLSKI